MVSLSAITRCGQRLHAFCHGLNIQKKGFIGRLLTKQYVGLINTIILRQKIGKKQIYNCNAGKKICVILPDGRISPCEPFLFDNQYADASSYCNIRDYDYDYARVCKDKTYCKMLDLVANQNCYACGWSCATITSMLYEPQNWKHLLIKPIYSESIR